MTILTLMNKCTLCDLQQITSPFRISISHMKTKTVISNTETKGESLTRFYMERTNTTSET